MLYQQPACLCALPCIYPHRWPELCSHPFWGASPPTLLQLPPEPVLQRLLDECGVSGGSGEEPGMNNPLASRHRASGSGSSLGGDAEWPANGVSPAGLQQGAASGGSARSSAGGSGSSGDYCRAATGEGEYDGGTAVRGGCASGDYSASAAVGQQAAAAAAAAMAATSAAAAAASTPQAASQQGAAAARSDAAAHAAVTETAAAAAAAAAVSDNPEATPAHPRAQSRTAGMACGTAAAGAAAAAAALASAVADGNAGIAPQFAAHVTPQLLQQPQLQTGAQGNSGNGCCGSSSGVDGGGAGRGGGVQAAAGLEALVYHPTDSVMKPIVGNKRCAWPAARLLLWSLPLVHVLCAVAFGVCLFGLAQASRIAADKAGRLCAAPRLACQLCPVG